MVNNLFQTRGGEYEWQANLRTYGESLGPKDYFEYGRGNTAEEALKDAFENARIYVAKKPTGLDDLL